MRRTHRCGEVTREQLGQKVVLQGWVWHRRDMGGLIFIDLRDRAGFVQCVFNPESDEAIHTIAHGWRPEYVVEIEGTVIERGANVNTSLVNGDIEVAVTAATLLATSETPPFVIEEEPRTSEEMRLRNRFLDLRRGPLQRALALRHRLALETRLALDELGFLEIETPMLTRSTPEGARDYLVPSRVHPGHFYALPQSPQLFKQLLMVSGYDRYFQIVRCFRDEDLRADRQPEFTQIDVEMSFVCPEDVQEVAETVVRRLLKASGHDGEVEFPRMTFREALDRFGTDRPDTRYGHELVDVTEELAGCEFRAFAQVAAEGGAIKGLVVPGGAEWTRSRLDKLTELAKSAGARGLVWIKRLEGEYASPVAKFLGEEVLDRVATGAGVGTGDLLLLAADEWEIAALTMGTIRSALAVEEGWIREGMRFLWVTDFPLLERDQEEGRMVARHHPFTSPLEEDLDLLESDPLAVRAQAYDLVLNGVELGGGSIRIHREELQERVFSVMGISPEEAQEKFGFLLRALRFGAPPHGGIALGFDRIVMLMAGLRSLRDVIAFPKTTTAQDAMTDAPGTAAPDQLAGLHIALVGKAEEQPGE